MKNRLTGSWILFFVLSGLFLVSCNTAPTLKLNKGTRIALVGNNLGSRMMEYVEVLDVMRNITKQGFTNIIVTHEMGFAKEVADEVIFMYQGRIWEHGSKESFFGQPQTMEAKAFLEKIL